MENLGKKRGFYLFPILFKNRLFDAHSFEGWVRALVKVCYEFNMLDLVGDHDNQATWTEDEKRKFQEKRIFMTRLMLETGKIIYEFIRFFIYN